MPATAPDLFHSDSTLRRLRFESQPQANPASLVQRGEVRFTILTSRLLRLEWSATRQFEDRGTYAFPSRLGPVPDFQVSEVAGWLVLETGDLRLRYRLGSGKFSSDHLAIELAAPTGDQPATGARPATVWRPGMPNPGNLRSTRRTLDMCAGDSTLSEGILARDGWALHDDSLLVCFNPETGWVEPRPDHDLQDWYFFGYGHDYRAALQEYTRFGGAPPLIPRYVLGAWWSRYWEYSDHDLKSLVAEFRQHELPLDVLVIDMDWHTRHAWTGYTWNQELFPDPAGFLEWVHQQGLRATLNLHPAQGVQNFEAIYPRFATAMDVDPHSAQTIPIRITDPRFVKHYFELLHHPMEDQGVDFWWMDWQQGETSEMKGLDPLPWINHLHFKDAARRGRRPMLYSRWGGLGNHRYHIGFSGDTFAVWHALQFQPYMTATAANLAYGWWSHDIGGHMGGATDPELYARWVQFGALSPVLRLHSTKDPRAERRPWAYPPQVYQAAKAAFKLRYQLVPYLYSMARLASDSSIALCRPMYFEHPEAEAAYAARYQYYLGDQLIAAPIVFPADPQTGLAVSDVWLPEGNWIDYQTLESFQGPRWVRLVGDLQRLPMLVRAGGILPMAEVAPTTEALDPQHLILELFPLGESALRLYEDQGDSDAYLRGECEWTPLYNRVQGSQWLVGIGPVEGHCPALPHRRSYELRLRGCQPPETIALDGGAELSWQYDPTNLTLSVQIPARPKDQQLRLQVQASGEINALDQAQQQACIAADVRRALGANCPANPLDLPAMLALGEIAGREAALARLGAPWVRCIEFSTPEEASQQLGRLIIAGAQNGEAYDLEIDFSLQHGLHQQQYHINQPGLRGDQMLDTPFAFDGQVCNQNWQAQIRLTWRGQVRQFNYHSMPFFPAVTHWQVAFSEAADFPALPQLLATNPPALAWQEHNQDLAQIWSNLHDPHVLRLSRLQSEPLRAGASLKACLKTTVTVAEAQNVLLEVILGGEAQVYLNGQLVELSLQQRQLPVPPFYWNPYRSGVLQLKSGPNSVLVISQPPQAGGYDELPRWLFGAAFLDPEGGLLSGLAYG